MEQISQEYKAVNLIRPKSIAATETGTGVDLGPDFYDDAIAVLNVGAVADAGATLAVTIEASDAVGGTYAVIGTFTTMIDTDDNKLAAIGIDTKGAARRFVRAVATVAGGTTPAILLSVVLLVKSVVGKTGLNSATAA